MDRVFLDANVLFSAAYRPDSRLINLWSFSRAVLVTSPLAVEEARRNLVVHRPEAVLRLEKLLVGVEIVHGSDSHPPDEVDIDTKDAPILNAAISAKCTHLVTGDHRHFANLFGCSVLGVLVMTPAQYMKDCTA